jgi:hypothetical protein
MRQRERKRNRETTRDTMVAMVDSRSGRVKLSGVSAARWRCEIGACQIEENEAQSDVVK